MDTGLIKTTVFCYLSFMLNLSFAQQPRLMLPLGHSSSIDYASFSPDGKKILTSSMGDNNSKIWEARSGTLLSNLEHKDGISSSSFSPDGKKIVTSSFDSTAKIWDAQSGALLFNLKHKERVTYASFSPDGKIIVTTSNDSTFKIWDVKSGVIRAFLKNTARVYRASFSPDGKSILFPNKDSTAKIWDLQSGAVLTSLKHKAKVMSASFSPNGKIIVTTCDDSTANVWDVESATILAELKDISWHLYIPFSADGKYFLLKSIDSSVKLWNVQNRAMLADLKHANRVKSTFFSPDGKKIVTSSDSTTKIWDAQSGALLSTLKHAESMQTTFSPDAKMILTINGRIATILDAQSGAVLATLKGRTRLLSNASFSPDGKLIVTQSFNRIATIWDAQSSVVLDNLRRYSNKDEFVFASPDGKKILIWGNSTPKILDVQSGMVLAELKGRSDRFLRIINFSPDGKKIATSLSDSTIMIWDVHSGSIIATLKHTGDVRSTNFSKDGKKIVTTAYNDSTAKIWEVQSGIIISTLKYSAWVTNASFSSDGKKIVTTSYDFNANVWEVQSGINISTLKDSAWVTNASFSPDGNKILTVSSDYSAKIWDAQSGAILATLKHTGDVRSANFSPDGEKILTVEGTTVALWDTYKKSFLYSFFQVDTGDYLIVDKYNRYDGTDVARKLLYFTCGSEIIELNQIKDQLWVPNLAERINRDEIINAKKIDEINICGLIPEIEDATSKAEEYYFKIKSRRGGLGETVLLVNGIEVRRYKVSELKKNGELYDLIIKRAELKNLFISGKENSVTLKTYTTNNAISSRGIIIKEDKSKETTIPPNLYAVMIGISDYKDMELDLKYAAKDASDISTVIANAAKKLLNTDGKEHVFMYNLTTAKDRYQLPEKNGVKKLLEEIGKKATANDILLIFFAGHGVMHGETNNKQFYFLTTEASRILAASIVSEVGISMAELTDWIKPANIKAQKRILIFDACNSGQAIRDFVKLGNKDQGYVSARSDEKAQELKAIDKLNEKSGLFILSASASNQYAYEMGRYSQGLLTYSLLKAVKQNPDILNEGKYLDVNRWFNAAKESVSGLAKEGGARQEPQIVSNTNFNIGIVDDEVISKIILPMEKPLFASCNFQNVDDNIAADNLGLNQLTDLQLYEISSRSTDAAIVFAGSTVSKDAYSLSGRYTILDSTISIRIFIRHKNEVKHKIDLIGAKDKLEEFATLIASRTAEWVSKNK